MDIYLMILIVMAIIGIIKEELNLNDNKTETQIKKFKETCEKARKFKTGESK